LKQVYGEKKDPETCWIITSYYFKGYGVGFDPSQSLSYAGIVD
jgi:hypothetical protein